MKPSVGLLFIMVQFYLVEMATTDNADDTKLQEKDPCDSINHVTIDEPERAVGFNEDPGAKHQPFCDRNLTEGWYHFKLNGFTAEIPTTCLRSQSCGGSVAMRIDLDEQELPAVDKEIHAWICGSFEILGHWDCCVLRQTTRIRNCGKFIIYYLYPVDRCPVSYCVRDPKEEIPEELTVKQGEVVDDVTVQTTTETSTLFRFCPEGQFKCNVNNTMTCTPKCNGVVDCDDGADEEQCYGQTTMIDEKYPPPPPTPEEDYDSYVPDSSGAGDNYITNSTDNVIATRSLYSVSTTPIDVSQEVSTSSHTQAGDNTAESVNPSTDDDLSAKNATFVDINKGELTTAPSTLTSDVVSTDGGVTYGQNETLPEEFTSNSSNSSSSNKHTVTTELPVRESDNTTDVSGATTSLSNDTEKDATTTQTPTTSLSSVSPGKDITEVSAPRVDPSSTTSHIDQTNDDTTITKSISTTTTSTATTAKTETISSTIEMMSTIATVPTQSEDGRVVLVFRAVGDQIEEKANCTALMKMALLNVFGLMLDSEYDITNQSIVLTDGLTHHHDYVDLTFRLERENGIVPADRVIQFFRVLQHSPEDSLPWHQMGLKLVDFYKPEDRPQTQQDKSLFKDNLILFIAIIAIGSVCIVVIIFGLLYIRCRNRRRSWDRNSDKKYTLSETHAVHTVENPATDAEIMKDEINPSKETPLSTQDTRPSYQLPPGAPPEDENGWIVPLDQAEFVAVKTEDTRF